MPKVMSTHGWPTVKVCPAICRQGMLTESTVAVTGLVDATVPTRPVRFAAPVSGCFNAFSRSISLACIVAHLSFVACLHAHAASYKIPGDCVDVVPVHGLVDAFIGVGGQEYFDDVALV